jgi:hypothetical protein
LIFFRISLSPSLTWRSSINNMTFSSFPDHSLP